MRLTLTVLLYSLVACGSTADASEPAAIFEASRLEESGDFMAAAGVLKQAMTDSRLTAAESRQLEFELDRLDRIRRDFPLTREGLFNGLKAAVRGFSEAEFEKWLAEGRFDIRTIDGEPRFMVSSVKNLFWRYPELESRRTPPKDTAAYQRAVLETCAAITEAVRRTGAPYVLPRQVRVTMTVTASANAAPAGETIRAWLPVPRHYPFQGGFRLLGSSSPVRHLTAEDSPIRSVLLAQPAVADRPTVFRIEYCYTAHGVRFEIDPDKVQPSDPTNPELAPFLREGPHVRFTPELRALAERIAGAETNPAGLARRFYDWIADNIRYSYSIEYCTIRDIAEYCRSRGYGDCGQEGMLFIALCRLRGIPARWQSGWNTFPGSVGIHDWTEIHLAPYGWVPVDPWAGIYFTQYASALTSDERRVVRDFYFGGLDQHRMAANSDHCQQLDPPKRSLRSDTVDFQRGELEWADRNLYFDKFSYTLQTAPSP